MSEQAEVIVKLAFVAVAVVSIAVVLLWHHWRPTWEERWKERNVKVLRKFLPGWDINHDGCNFVAQHLVRGTVVAHEGPMCLSWLVIQAEHDWNEQGEEVSDED